MTDYVALKLQTIAPGDKVAMVPDKKGRLIAVKLDTIAPGDKVVMLPTRTGNVAVKLNPLILGDKVLLVPSMYQSKTTPTVRPDVYTLIWTTEIVDSTNDVGSHCSLAIDSGDTLHIAFYDATNGYLKYATGTPGGLSVAVVDNTANVGQYTSIAVAPDGTIGISYYDITNTRLKYASKSSGGGWSISVIDGPATPPHALFGAMSSLKFDSGSIPCISYHDAENRDLKYSYNGIPETVDSAGDVGYYTSLAIDPATDYPQISYYDAGNIRLKYAYWTGAAWDKSVVDSGSSNRGTFTSIRLDGSGYPKISYYDVGNFALKYANWTGAAWDKDSIDTLAHVGKYSSLALNSSFEPRFAYYDETNGNLKFSWLNGTVFVAANFTISTIDSAGDVGKYSSLALDSDDNPRIAYYDVTNGNLKLAVGAWMTT
jgi:hypothetical protein